LYYLHAASHFVDRPEWAEIGHNGADLMIAASALRHGGIVVTNNTGDFAPTGAALENPF
jgi:predicted nucleic acid-binding protein